MSDVQAPNGSKETAPIRNHFSLGMSGLLTAPLRHFPSC
jgi:hypothetical protein